VADKTILMRAGLSKQAFNSTDPAVFTPYLTAVLIKALHL